ncbi:MAG: hypothetical protein R2712_30620 [Vicinamibacterales bacterium]
MLAAAGREGCTSATAFDLAAAAARIRATAYPGADAFATQHVLAPPSEAQMLALFEPAPKQAP